MEDYGNDDPDKLIFTGKKATHNGAGNHLQITHEDFFGAHASQERNVYVMVEKHVSKTTLAQRRAIIEHEDLTLEIGKLRPRLREMEARLRALSGADGKPKIEPAAGAAASHATATASPTPEMPSTSITKKRTRRLEGELRQLSHDGVFDLRLWRCSAREPLGSTPTTEPTTT